jgi:hypothetical protein
MKIYYLNDESAPVVIRLLGKAPNYHDNEYVTLQPQEGRVFEIEAPPDSIPYVKRWDNRMILLSYMPAQTSEKT